MALALVCTFFVAAQDFLIFPSSIGARLSSSSPPPGTEELRAIAGDGESVRIWRLRSDDRRGTAILFHGNAETLATFHQVQRWLRSLGFTSYSVEYRGYSSGTGWLSESGLYADADAAVDLIATEESIAPREILAFGASIGSGLASYVAERHGVSTVVLVAPFISLTKLISEMSLVGYLAPFLRYDFPVMDRIGRLGESCLVLVHGKRDDVVPFRHSEALARAFSGARLELVASAEAGHNDVLGRSLEEVSSAIRRCGEAS